MNIKAMFNKYSALFRNRANMLAILLALPLANFAQQTKVLTLDEAISLGLANSKTLKLSQNKVAQAESVYQQTLDQVLPSAKASAMYNHAEIPNHVLQLGPGDPITLPSRADAYLGTLSVQELIFAGNKLKYAKESTSLLKKIAELDVDKDKDEVTINLINAYLNLYKLDASKKVIIQNLASLDKQYKQTQRFFEQGIVTKNEVLRLQLQKSNVELTGLDLDKNRNIVNYNLDVLLGLPENTLIQIAPLSVANAKDINLEEAIEAAKSKRLEIKQVDYSTVIADKSISSLKADQLPTLGAGLGAYYVNPSGSFIPSQNQFITPVTLGLTLSWNISSLWLNKNKVSEAAIKKQETLINKDILLDNIKLDVNRNYESYQQALKRIKLLSVSIDQATENENIVESKYNNNIASVTDRLDANTQLFQAKINLEIAKADAQIAYYNLLKSTGQQLTQ